VIHSLTEIETEISKYVLTTTENKTKVISIIKSITETEMI